MIDTAQEFNSSIRTIAGQICRSEESSLRVITEGITDKLLGCQLWSIVVATSHTNSTNIEFASNAYRYRLTCGIENVDLCVRDRIANRYEVGMMHGIAARHDPYVLVTALTLPCCDIDGGLCWPIEVMQLDRLGKAGKKAFLQIARQRLTTTDDPFQ